jgi:hypothetical protein
MHLHAADDNEFSAKWKIERDRAAWLFSVSGRSRLEFRAVQAPIRRAHHREASSLTLAAIRRLSVAFKNARTFIEGFMPGARIELARLFRDPGF